MSDTSTLEALARYHHLRVMGDGTRWNEAILAAGHYRIRLQNFYGQPRWLVVGESPTNEKEQATVFTSEALANEALKELIGHVTRKEFI